MRNPAHRRIGLLGGSFNPAHDGHLHISRVALKRLRLDEVWWLVSPGNPLKDPAEMASLDDRLASAVQMASPEKRIWPMALETDLGTVHTADTLLALRDLFPTTRFVWMMGADNLIQLPQWVDWPAIFHTVPVAVFTRAPYSYPALNGRAARLFATARMPDDKAYALADSAAPAWMFLRCPANPTSATLIRADGQWPILPDKVQH